MYNMRGKDVRTEERDGYRSEEKVDGEEKSDKSREVEYNFEADEGGDTHWDTAQLDTVRMDTKYWTHTLHDWTLNDRIQHDWTHTLYEWTLRDWTLHDWTPHN